MRSHTKTGCLIVATLIAVVRAGCYTGELAAGEDCTLYPDCCPAGTKCFSKTISFAECLATCDSCQELTCTAGLSDRGVFDNRNFATKNGKLKLSGVDLVNEAGKSVHLTGVESFLLEYGLNCFSENGVKFLASDWGANVVKAIISFDKGIPSTDEINNLKAVVDSAEKAGIYVIISSWFSENPFPNLENAKSFWKTIAPLYKNKKHILYDIAGQPSTSVWSGSNGLKAYLDGVIAEIRNYDSETIIIAATPEWNQRLDLPVGTPLVNPYNVMFSVMFASAEENLNTVKTRIDPYSSKIPIFITGWKPPSHAENYGPNVAQARSVLDYYSTGASGVRKLSWVMKAHTDEFEDSTNKPLRFATLAPGSCATEKYHQTLCIGTFAKLYLREIQSGGTNRPTAAPTSEPTMKPSMKPTKAPTKSPPPSFKPTESPTNQGETRTPTAVPTIAPTESDGETQPPVPAPNAPAASPVEKPTSTPQPSTSTSSDSSIGGGNSALIVGGAIGGTFLLAALAFVVTWKLKEPSPLTASPAWSLDKSNSPGPVVASPVPGEFQGDGSYRGSSSNSYRSGDLVFATPVAASPPLLSRARQYFSSRAPVFAFMRDRLSSRPPPPPQSPGLGLRPHGPQFLPPPRIGLESFEARARSPSV